MRSVNGLREAVAILVYAATLCSSVDSRTTPAGIPAALVQRTGCLDSCPSYEAEIYADGRVVWNGDEDVAVKGRSEARIDAAAIATLFEKYFPNVEREICIEEDGVDAPTYYVLFSRSGNLAQVKAQADDYYTDRQSDPTIAEPFCGLGEKFGAAITELERVSNTHRWVHGKESLQESQKVAADVFYGTKPGFTVMMQAAGEGKLEDLTTGTTPVAATDESGWTALMVAASLCRSQVVAFLLSKGASPNALDRSGDSSLIAAATAYCGRFDTDEEPNARYGLIKQLVAAGAKVNGANTAGQTALMVAARFGNDDAVRALLDSGANVRARDKAGMDAKAYATKYQRDIRNRNSDYQREYRDRFRNCLRLLSNSQQQRSLR